MEERGVTAAQLTREISLTNGLVTQWKKGLQKPSTDAIIKISKYFNVSTDYILLGVVDIKPNERLRNLREVMGLTQKEVADRVGVDEQTYSTYETDPMYLPLDMFKKLASVLGVSAYYLLTGREMQDVNAPPRPTFVIPPELKDVKVAFSGGKSDLTQEEVDEVAEFVKFLKARRESRKKGNSYYCLR